MVACVATLALLMTHPKFRAFKRDSYLTWIMANQSLQTTVREQTSRLATNCAMRGQFAMTGAIMMTRYHGKCSNAQDLMLAGKYFLLAKDIGAAKHAFNCAQEVSATPALFSVQRETWHTYIEHGKDEIVREELKIAEGARPYKTLIGRRHYWYNLKETYEELGDADGAARMKARMEDKHCPVCGSDEAITQLIDEELLKICRIQRSEPWDAKWRCSKDKVDF